MERPRGASEEEDGGSGIDENGEDPNAADLRAVLEQIRLNASTSPSACPLGPSMEGEYASFITEHVIPPRATPQRHTEAAWRPSDRRASYTRALCP
jgi:hypothetical protein